MEKWRNGKKLSFRRLIGRRNPTKSIDGRIEHGISPSGRNDILELCNSLGRQGRMTRSIQENIFGAKSGLLKNFINKFSHDEFH